jgi:NAD(P)H dehydrogenase (quinone)
MKIVVVYSHPVAESFGAAVLETVLSALQANGHEVRLLDLYQMNFDPVMQADERRTYNDRAPTDPALTEHIEALRWAEGIVFVYPTWWYSMPAIMKGWFDRVWGVDVAFALDPNGGAIVPLMRHVKFLAVVTTCGASFLISHLMGHPGRRIILRGIRAICAPTVRTMFMAHYRMDSSTHESRTAYLAKVRRKLSKV